MSSFVRTVRKAAYQNNIEKRVQLYSCANIPEIRLEKQLFQWNAVWKDIQRRVPYYADLVCRKELPQFFESWEQFVECMPITTREDIQQQLNIRTDPIRPPDMSRITGGSTSEPVEIPAWRSENRWLMADAWMGRSWYGIDPSSKLFLFWGHWHLLGTGYKGLIKKASRITKDSLLGYHRFPVIDMRNEHLRKAADELIRFRPDYIIGYSAVLDQFVREVQDRKEDIENIGVRVVFGTAESFPNLESMPLIKAIFNCPVGMEYGAVETGVIGYTHPDGGFRTFYHSYFLEVQKERDGQESGPLYVTSLYPRCFPLVRYKIGDELVTYEPNKSVLGIDAFVKVDGRTKDFIEIVDGSRIRTTAFAHSVNHCRKIKQFQVIKEQGKISLHYLSSVELSSEELSVIRENLRNVHPFLQNIAIHRVKELEKTIAGKTPASICR